VKLSRRMQAVLVIAASLLFVVGAGVVWKAERVLRRSEHDVIAGQYLPLAVHLLHAQPNPGFEAISTPGEFRSAASFLGRLYLSGPTGLFAYSDDGVLEHVYRVGTDLPPAQLGRMAVGTLADSRTPELLIATAGEGVLAFDGQRFRQIRAAADLADRVTAILPLPSGRLLVGTEKQGLLVYDGKTLQRFHTTTNDVFVTALAGSEAEVWIGTLDRGILHWQGGQVDVIGEAQGLPDARVESIAVAPDAVYAGTPAGVAELRAGKVARVLAQGSYARALLADSDLLYVGGMDGSLVKADTRSAANQLSVRRHIAVHPESWKAAKEKDAEPVEELVRLGDARYAVRADQLLRLEGNGEWSTVLSGTDSFLTDRNISSLMVGSNGSLWVGYFDRGLDIVPAAGGRPEHIENDAIFCVNRIVEDTRQGAVVVATANGLVFFDRDGRQKQVLTRDAGLIANHVTDVALLEDGIVAATPAGITFFDSSGPHSMYAFEGLINNHVYALGVRSGNVLVGTLGGISLVSGGTVRRSLNTGNSALKANWITALAAAGGEEWFAGTYGAGIFRLGADGTVAATGAAGQGTVVNPGALFTDGRMVLAGTLGKGLLVGDANGTRWRTVTAGLPSLNITAIVVDHGVVYIGTDNGLVKIAEDRL
jgi:ligand-binding sensor domain-containing protein